MYTTEEAINDLAKIIAQQVSGVRDAHPTPEDIELATKLVETIDNHY